MGCGASSEANYVLRSVEPLPGGGPYGQPGAAGGGGVGAAGGRAGGGAAAAKTRGGLVVPPAWLAIPPLATTGGLGSTGLGGTGGSGDRASAYTGAGGSGGSSGGTNSPPGSGRSLSPPTGSDAKAGDASTGNISGARGSGANSGSSSSDRDRERSGRRSVGPTRSVAVTGPTRCTFDPTDYEFKHLLGRGMIGRVYLALHKPSDKYFAVKRLARAQIAKRRNMESITQEVSVLQSANNPFVIHLFTTLQDSQYIYMVQNYAMGGELYTRMTHGKLPAEVCKFYFAELAVVLNYLHNELHVCFRDLKPENALIDYTGHIQLIDFGLAVPLSAADGKIPEPKRAGTSQYMAPEQVDKRHPHGIEVDWWALGVILYEMLCGDSPFGDIGDDAKYQIFINITAGKKPSYPFGLNAHAKDLLNHLLEADPARRYKFKDVSIHPWLSGVNWADVAQRRLVPPFIPDGTAIGDHSNFAKRPADDSTPPALSIEDQVYTDLGALAGNGSSGGAQPRLSGTRATGSTLNSGGPLSPGFLPMSAMSKSKRRL